MTIDDLDNALAFAASDVHEGDTRMILLQAKGACRALAKEIGRMHDTEFRRLVAWQKELDQLRAEVKRLQAIVGKSLTDSVTERLDGIGCIGLSGVHITIHDDGTFTIGPQHGEWSHEAGDAAKELHGGN